MQLATDSHVLRLDTNAEGWSNISLLSNGKEVLLGAESQSIFTQRLLQYLTHIGQHDTIGELEGQDVAWVLALSEGHTSIYSNDCEHGSRLYIQDKSNKIVARIDLDKETIAEWVGVLTC